MKSTTQDYLKEMISDAIKQEHADHCFDNTLTLIKRKDFNMALTEANKVLEYSMCIEQKIAATGVIRAIETYDFVALDAIHHIVYDECLLNN